MGDSGNVMEIMFISLSCFSDSWSHVSDWIKTEKRRKLIKDHKNISTIFWVDSAAEVEMFKEIAMIWAWKAIGKLANSHYLER